MDDIQPLVQLYNSVLNEPEAARRRQIVARLWSEDASHCTETLEAHGHEAIEARIVGTYDKYVGSGEFVFRADADASGHHGWVMVPANGGEAAAAGTVFLLMGNDGRIRSDYQFSDPV